MMKIINEIGRIFLARISSIRIECLESSRAEVNKADEMISIRREDFGWAFFGLGRFIDYRFKDGAPTEIMIQAIESYLYLDGVRKGLPPLTIESLQAPVTPDTPDRIRETLQLLPFWLPGSSELLDYQKQLREGQSSD